MVPQIWNVGSVICDIIIAVWMTYYVRFAKNPSLSEEKIILLPCSLWQLSRYDASIKQTKIILKKIIRLTIETGSLTGVSTLLQSLIYGKESN